MTPDRGRIAYLTFARSAPPRGSAGILTLPSLKDINIVCWLICISLVAPLIVAVHDQPQQVARGTDFVGFYSVGRILNEYPAERLYDHALDVLAPLLVLQKSGPWFGFVLLLGSVGSAGWFPLRAWQKSTIHAEKPLPALIWGTTITWTMLLNVYVPVYDTVLVVLSIIITAAAFKEFAHRWFLGTVLASFCLFLGDAGCREADRVPSSKRNSSRAWDYATCSQCSGFGTTRFAFCDRGSG